MVREFEKELEEFVLSSSARSLNEWAFFLEHDGSVAGNECADVTFGDVRRERMLKICVLSSFAFFPRPAVSFL